MSLFFKKPVPPPRHSSVCTCVLCYQAGTGDFAYHWPWWKCKLFDALQAIRWCLHQLGRYLDSLADRFYEGPCISAGY